MNHFFAYINRMRFIQRWALMRNSYTECNDRPQQQDIHLKLAVHTEIAFFY